MGEKVNPEGASAPRHRPDPFATSSRGLVPYLVVVIVPGLAVFFGEIVDKLRQFHAHPAMICLLAPVILLGEMVPIRLLHHGDEEEVALSTTFALALLILAGQAPAMAAMAAASLASDLVRRRPARRAVFNVSQYSLSLALTALVFTALAPDMIGRGRLVAEDIPALGLGAVAYFAVNNTLPAIALALTQRLGVVRFLVNDLVLQATIAGLALAMVPMVIAVTSASWLFSPLLLVPLVVVYRSAASRGRLAFEAAHDPLTGLANRAELSRKVAARLEMAKMPNTGGALLLIDLDRFKEVNDVLGHGAGDMLLRQVGQRIRDALSPVDLAARFGGDEFAVLAGRGDGVSSAALAQRILGALVEPIPVGEASVTIDASIGITLIDPADTAEGEPPGAEELLRKADVALYQAKRAHCGYQLYERIRDNHQATGLTLLRQMHTALDEGHFVLHYQPKAAAASGDMVGVEALARWEHPEHGRLGPDAFIPLLEQSGLSRRFTSAVIDQALTDAVAWRNSGRQLPVAVNLTVRNVHDSRFPDDVAAALEKHGPGAARMLALEITEGIMLADPARVLSVLERLADLGIPLSLDDYGTGYSSLSYLRQLPINELKIDKSFIIGMSDHGHDAAIVRSTVDLAHNLGLRCVAEGVEDGATWAQLENVGCDIIQGYYLSRPKSAVDLSEWMTARDLEQGLRALPSVTVGPF